MAAAFPHDIVSRIKEETDIITVVRGYVTLKAAGAGFKGLCPFHREKTPSFNVDPNRQIYKCFGCGEGGDVISFLMKIEGISFPEALETLARPLDIDLASYLREDESEGERVAFHRANEAAAGIWQGALWDAKVGRAARNYLEGRQFSEEILRRFEVGFAPNDSRWFQNRLRRAGVREELALTSGLLRQKPGRPPFAYFYNRIIFPIKNIAQRIVGFGGRLIDRGEPKYLNSADSPYFSKGRLLYGFALSRMSIARLKTAILVEGYLDLLALAQAGFSNVVATCGTAFTIDQAKLIRRGCRSVVILFDGDSAGLQAAVKSSHLALAAGLEPKIARLPAGEDPASLLLDRDRAALEEVLAAAEDYLPFLLTLVRERGDKREAKERALRQALKTVALVEDPIRREYLVQEVADLYDIGREVVRDHVHREVQNREKKRGSTREPVPAVSGPDQAESPERAASFRSLAAVNRPRIEATLLAHVLRDQTGDAARLFLKEAGERRFADPAAEVLRQELSLWQQGADSGQTITPADFVQNRWHAKEEDYRRFVSELLTAEDIPDSADFARVVRDCLARLQQGPRQGLQ